MQKHIRIEKNAYLPGLVGTDSAYLQKWNSYQQKSSLVDTFRHPEFLNPTKLMLSQIIDQGSASRLEYSYNGKHTTGNLL